MEKFSTKVTEDVPTSLGENSGEKVYHVEVANTKSSAKKKSVKRFASGLCLKTTISFCVGGTVTGFCLLIAGGIGKHSDVKILMYVGILVFLVSLALLVIMCSSSATGTSRIPLPASVPASTCLYQNSYTTESSKLKFTCGDGDISHGISLYAIPHAKNSIYPLEYYIEIPQNQPLKLSDKTAKAPVCNLHCKAEEYGDTHLYPLPTNAHKAKGQQEPCAIKNCICQVKNPCLGGGEALNAPLPYGASISPPEDLFKEGGKVHPHVLSMQQPCQTHQDKLFQLNLKTSFDDEWHPHS